MSSQTLYTVVLSLSLPLGVLSVYALLDYSWGFHRTGLGRYNVARLWVLSDGMDLLENALDPDGPVLIAVWLSGAGFAIATALAWLWRKDDDDDFTKRRKRKQAQLSEALKAKFRSFAPSPLPSPT